MIGCENILAEKVSQRPRDFLLITAQWPRQKHWRKPGKDTRDASLHGTWRINSANHNELQFQFNGWRMEIKFP